MAERVFARVLCGIDETVESAEAAWQASLLAPRGAEFLLVSMTEHVGATPPGWGVVTIPGLEAHRRSEEVLERARTRIAELHAVDVRLLEGAIPILLATVERERATLVTVGIHRHSRAAGIALGSVATAMLHDAPCSVYVWRGPSGVEGPPRDVVVGVDGSAAAGSAIAVARELAGRIGARLSAVVALGAGQVDRERVEQALEAMPDVALVEDERGPVDSLVEAGAELIVVGSRGLRGVRALGSVSERVAHQARCPVLVVRTRSVDAPRRRERTAGSTR